MRVPAYPIMAYRGGKWSEIMTDRLLPGDFVALGRQKTEVVRDLNDLFVCMF